MTEEAAQALIERALQADAQSTANILIDAAQRLDPTIDAGAIRKQWLEQWMKKEYQAMIERNTNQ